MPWVFITISNFISINQSVANASPHIDWREFILSNLHVRMQHIRRFEKKYFVLGLIIRFYSPLLKWHMVIMNSVQNQKSKEKCKTGAEQTVTSKKVRGTFRTWYHWRVTGHASRVLFVKYVMTLTIEREQFQSCLMKYFDSTLR